MKILVTALLSISLCSIATAQEKSAQDLMLISKFVGICGVMQQMAAFQKANNLPGGSEFATSFWQSEFVRLKKPQSQFFKECEEAIQTYGQLYDAFGITK